MTLSDLDRLRLREALQIAERAIGLSDPNPRVGCILGREDGRILGDGHTQEAGGPHAEVMALRAAQPPAPTFAAPRRGSRSNPAPTMVARRHAAMRSSRPVWRGWSSRSATPAPRCRGGCVANARGRHRSGLSDHDLETAAREVNLGFFSRIERGRPWIRLKVATSLDGVTALATGASQWITGEAARADGHAWRRRANAVLTGIGTVLADDPRLDVRHVHTSTQPMRVVVDSSVRIPELARLRPPGRVLVACAADPAQRAESIRTRGAEICLLPTRTGQVDLVRLVDELARREVNELHVEAGPRLNAALLQAGLVDELLVYQAPRLLGPGRPIAALDPIEDLRHSIDFAFVDSTAVGGDLRMILRKGFRKANQSDAIGEP